MSLRRMSIGRALATRGAVYRRAPRALELSPHLRERVRRRSPIRDLASDIAMDMLVASGFFLAAIGCGLLGAAVVERVLR